MRELFLTFMVEDHARATSINILGRYCDMYPKEILRRRLIWIPQVERSAKKQLKKKPGALIKDTETGNDPWKVLDSHLDRQPYILTIQYDIRREQFSSFMDCNESEGCLVWADVPIPGENQQVNDRDMVKILSRDDRKEDGRDLATKVQKIKDMNFRYAGEMIEEGYTFVRGNVVINLTRMLPISSHLQQRDEHGNVQINTVLPPYEELQPYDPENKWVLTAKVEVEDKKLVQQAKDELVALQRELVGCFNLKFVDRFAFDTRVRI